MDLSQFGTVDPQILTLLNEAYKRNPSLRQQIGEGESGPTFGMDPGAQSGNFYLSLDENGQPLIYKDLERNTLGQDSAVVYGMDGKPVGISSGDSTALGLTKFILGSLAMYGGLSAADGALNGATAAGGSAAGSAAPMSAEQAAFLEANMGAGAPMAGMPGSAWYNAVQPVLGTDAANLAYGAGNLAGGAGTTGSMFSTGGGGITSSLVNGAKDVMGSGGLNWGGVLGAVAGAVDSRDQEQKQSRDPWEPAQPFLKQQIQQGQDLSNRYQANPFSADQQTGYNNTFGLLNAINQNAGGLLNGFNANASGANQFVRGQPQRLQGSTFNLGGYTPGLLTGFTRG